MSSDQTAAQGPSWIELESVIPLSTEADTTSAEGVTNLSPDTMQRRYPELIVRLSPRRRGMKLRHALAIADGSYVPPAKERILTSAK